MQNNTWNTPLAAYATALLFFIGTGTTGAQGVRNAHTPAKPQTIQQPALKPATIAKPVSVQKATPVPPAVAKPATAPAAAAHQQHPRPQLPATPPVAPPSQVKPGTRSATTVR